MSLGETPVFVERLFIICEKVNQHKTYLSAKIHTYGNTITVFVHTSKIVCGFRMTLQTQVNVKSTSKKLSFDLIVCFPVAVKSHFVVYSFVNKTASVQCTWENINTE
jgi:hypothetical protein